MRRVHAAATRTCVHQPYAACHRRIKRAPVKRGRGSRHSRLQAQFCERTLCAHAQENHSLEVRKQRPLEAPRPLRPLHGIIDIPLIHPALRIVQPVTRVRYHTAVGPAREGRNHWQTEHATKRRAPIAGRVCGGRNTALRTDASRT